MWILHSLWNLDFMLRVSYPPGVPQVALGHFEVSGSCNITTVSEMVESQRAYRLESKVNQVRGFQYVSSIANGFPSENSARQHQATSGGTVHGPLVGAVWLAGATCRAAWAQQGRPPNVIVFLSDDQGWGDLSVHGNTNLQTPHIDSLAEDGALFDRFYVCPVCSPTRAEFLTGRYHPRGGVYSTSRGGERLDLDEMTIAQTFRASGYATAAFGKWHNGTQYPYHPCARL